MDGIYDDDGRMAYGWLRGATDTDPPCPCFLRLPTLFLCATCHRAAQILVGKQTIGVIINDARLEFFIAGINTDGHGPAGPDDFGVEIRLGDSPPEAPAEASLPGDNIVRPDFAQGGKDQGQ